MYADYLVGGKRTGSCQLLREEVLDSEELRSKVNKLALSFFLKEGS